MRNIKRIESIFRDLASMTEDTDLVIQTTALVVQDSWEMHDVDDVSMSAELNGIALSGLALLAKTGSALVRIMPDAGLLDDRDQTALAAADTYFEGNPMVVRCCHGVPQYMGLNYRKAYACFR